VEEEEERWSFLALLFELLQKSLLGCRTVGGGGEGEHGGGGMEIGLPTDVQHVAHVTFDRFHGFLGLPVEFKPEVPLRAPSVRIFEPVQDGAQVGSCQVPITSVLNSKCW